MVRIATTTGRMLLAVAIALVLQAEKCSDTSPVSCKKLAVVKDYGGLDGCDLLFIVSDDLKLLATNLDTFDLELSDGDVVLLGYSVLDDAASICMAEDAIVALHCLQEAPGLRANAACEPLLDPYRQEWSLAVMKEIQPFRIEELKIGKARLYHFYSKTENKLYACHGEHICTYPPGKRGECQAYLDAAGKGTIIFVEDQ